MQWWRWIIGLLGWDELWAAVVVRFSGWLSFDPAVCMAVRLACSRAARTTGASVCSSTPLCFALGESSQSQSSFAPLDALQPTQQSAMFSSVVMLMSLMMCSHERFLLRSELNWQPQYTQLVSRFITAVSIFSGIPQRLLKLNLPIFNLGCKSIQ